MYVTTVTLTTNIFTTQQKPARYVPIIRYQRYVNDRIQLQFKDFVPETVYRCGYFKSCMIQCIQLYSGSDTVHIVHWYVTRKIKLPVRIERISKLIFFFGNVTAEVQLLSNGSSLEIYCSTIFQTDVCPHRGGYKRGPVPLWKHPHDLDDNIFLAVVFVM